MVESVEAPPDVPVDAGAGPVPRQASAGSRPQARRRLSCVPRRHAGHIGVDAARTRTVLAGAGPYAATRWPTCWQRGWGGLAEAPPLEPADAAVGVDVTLTMPAHRLRAAGSGVDAHCAGGRRPPWPRSGRAAPASARPATARLRRRATCSRSAACRQGRNPLANRQRSSTIRQSSGTPAAARATRLRSERPVTGQATVRPSVARYGFCGCEFRR